VPLFLQKYSGCIFEQEQIMRIKVKQITGHLLLPAKSIDY